MLCFIKLFVLGKIMASAQEQELLNAVKAQDLYTVQLILEQQGHVISDKTLQEAFRIAKIPDYGKAWYTLDTDKIFKVPSVNINMVSELAWFMRKNNRPNPDYNTPTSKVEILKTAFKSSIFGAMFVGISIIAAALIVPLPGLFLGNSFIAMALLAPTGSAAAGMVAIVAMATIAVSMFVIAASVVAAVAYAIINPIRTAMQLFSDDKKIKYSNTDLAHTILNQHPNALRRLLINDNPDPNSKEFKDAMDLVQNAKYKDDIRAILDIYAQNPKNPQELPMFKPSFKIPSEVKNKIQKFYKNKSSAMQMDKFIADLEKVFNIQYEIIIKSPEDIDEIEYLDRDWKHIINSENNKVFLERIDKYLFRLRNAAYNKEQPSYMQEEPNNISQSILERKRSLFNQFTDSINELDADYDEILQHDSNKNRL